MRSKCFLSIGNDIPLLRHQTILAEVLSYTFALYSIGQVIIGKKDELTNLNTDTLIDHPETAKLLIDEFKYPIMRGIADSGEKPKSVSPESWLTSLNKLLNVLYLSSGYRIAGVTIEDAYKAYSEDVMCDFIILFALEYAKQSPYEKIIKNIISSKSIEELTAHLTYFLGMFCDTEEVMDEIVKTTFVALDKCYEDDDSDDPEAAPIEFYVESIEEALYPDSAIRNFKDLYSLPMSNYFD